MPETEFKANRSTAVVAQRFESRDSLDNFPTPPWATRALMEHVIARETNSCLALSCLEPACGRGDMAFVLYEYFDRIHFSDIHDYGIKAGIGDFLDESYLEREHYDWVITNPPFKLAQEFALRALDIANRGVALLVRTQFLEGKGRYAKLFKDTPPSIVAQFTERVSMVRGKLDPKASRPTAYCWMVWYEAAMRTPTRLMWIPPCRDYLERDEDYPDE